MLTPVTRANPVFREILVAMLEGKGYYLGNEKCIRV